MSVGPRVMDTTRSHVAPQVVIDRVLEQADRDGPCLISRYGVAGGRYPRVGWTAYGRAVWAGVHRVVWQFLYGPIRDPDLLVLRTCGNRRCIEPAHLRATTQAEQARRIHGVS